MVFSATRRLRANALYSVEYTLIGSIILTILMSGLLSHIANQSVAWSGFSLAYGLAIGALALGLYIRVIKAMPGLGLLSISYAIYVGFSSAITLLIYLRFPVEVALIDPLLISLDAKLGYSWQRGAALLAEYPAISAVLRLVYQSSLLQLFLLLAALCALGQFDRVHKAMFTGIFSLLLTVAIWWIWPSIGPAAYAELAKDIEIKAALVTNAQMGAYLQHLVQNGLEEISPDKIVGTIAFPSYHTVMALLVVWYTRGTLLFLPALLVNLAMMPAILTHGGHHLLDVLGGLYVFFLSAWAASVFLTPRSQPAEPLQS